MFARRSGATGEDQETIWIRLDQVSEDVQTIAITVTIHEAKRRWQHFGMIQNAYIRLYDDTDGAELMRFNISDSVALLVVSG